MSRRHSKRHGRRKSGAGRRLEFIKQTGRNGLEKIRKASRSVGKYARSALKTSRDKASAIMTSLRNFSKYEKDRVMTFINRLKQDKKHAKQVAKAQKTIATLPASPPPILSSSLAPSSSSIAPLAAPAIAPASAAPSTSSLASILSGNASSPSVVSKPVVGGRRRSKRRYM